ncbi:RWD-domain-containing protein [Aulographum hederae CBS 113979]|uniref:RBR-type E3 ubiquitin transferase n=1 Tax=Aulographum hederae CBS 113979 TaxID=1176131 RepID=A0A6G1HAY6_9PEZI|nr:RWD-domain-containing protein [Aulographum hederae CBS 113979]
MESSEDDERAEELSSISAIFPELVVDDNSPFTATLDLAITPNDALPVLFAADVDILTPPSSPLEAQAPKNLDFLSHLPALRLTISLHEGYPAELPPQVELKTTPAWLPEAKLRELEEAAASTWEEYGRGQAVYGYIDFLQEQAAMGFGLSSEQHPLSLPAALKPTLLEFNKQEKRRQFEEGTYDCGVCLEPKKGTACYRLERCSHVFCISCLKDFYISCITQGDVASVTCLDPDCGKETGPGRRNKPRRTLNPIELLDIPLSEDVVRRYAELKRTKKIESDPDTIFCPRAWCQAPARSAKYPPIKDLVSLTYDNENDGATQEAPPVESKVKGNEERLSVCEKCGLAFCRVCKLGWHGDLQYCNVKTDKPEDELSEEEIASLRYIRLHTSACPTCKVPAQKMYGCNHMTCFQCRTHFCYLCEAWLNPNNVYDHFNDQKNECFNRLFDLDQGDNADGRVQFVGARRFEMEAERFEEEARVAEAARRRELEAAATAIAAAQAAQGVDLFDTPQRC